MLGVPTFDPQVRVSVLGPPDLLVTSLVAALTADGVPAARMPVRDAVRDGALFPMRGPGVLVVDIDVHNPVPVIPRATRAGVTVLVMGQEENRERAAAAIAAGAVGWVRKTSSIDALVETVREALAGRMQLTTEQRATWLAEHRVSHDSVRTQVGRLEQLSPREREVLRLLADGVRATEISGLLFLSIATVRSHIRSILLKLGAFEEISFDVTIPAYGKAGPGGAALVVNPDSESPQWLVFGPTPGGPAVSPLICAEPLCVNGVYEDFVEPVGRAVVGVGASERVPVAS